MAASPPPQHSAFTSWAAQTRGLRTHLIAPASIPGAGLGIVATDDISAATEIASCPRPALLNRDTVRAFAPGLPWERGVEGLSTHALLALALVTERDNAANPWRMWVPTFPSIDDLRGLPILWSDVEKALLPASAQSLLSAMERRFLSDWGAVRSLRLEVGDEDTFRWAWLVVNTRTLFYPQKNAKRKDCMTMCPFIDYFNHTSAASACVAVFSPKGGYSVTTSTPIRKGEEIFVTYGHHSCDLLLVEYGFVPADNASDALLLDPWLRSLPQMEARKALLEEQGYWENWVLDCEGWCYRTEVAVRLLVAGESRWWAFLAGDEGGLVEKARVKGVLKGVMAAIREDAAAALKGVDAASKEVGETLTRRWRQIEGILEEVANGLET